MHGRFGAVVVAGEPVRDIKFHDNIVMCVGEGEEILYNKNSYLDKYEMLGGKGVERTPPIALALLVMVRGMGWNAIVPIMPRSPTTVDVVL